MPCKVTCEPWCENLKIRQTTQNLGKWKEPSNEKAAIKTIKTLYYFPLSAECTCQRINLPDYLLKRWDAKSKSVGVVVDRLNFLCAWAWRKWGTNSKTAGVWLQRHVQYLVLLKKSPGLEVQCGAKPVPQVVYPKPFEYFIHQNKDGKSGLKGSRHPIHTQLVL